MGAFCWMFSVCVCMCRIHLRQNKMMIDSIHTINPYVSGAIFSTKKKQNNETHTWLLVVVVISRSSFVVVRLIRFSQHFWLVDGHQFFVYGNLISQVLMVPS